MKQTILKFLISGLILTFTQPIFAGSIDCSSNDPSINLATFEMTGKPKTLSTLTQTDILTTWYSQKMKIISNKDSAILFNEFVICKAVRYIGPLRSQLIQII